MTLTVINVRCPADKLLLADVVFHLPVIRRSTYVRLRDSQNSLVRGHPSLREMVIQYWWLLNS